MHINTRPVQFLSYQGGFWFRLFGYGLSINNSRLTFSQRNGYTKYARLPFGYKAVWLKPCES